MKLVTVQNYLLLIDEEAEIKVGDYIYETDTLFINNVGKDYICNDKDFKIIAYCPLTKEAKELDLPLLPNPFEEIDIYVKKESYEKELLKKGWDKDIAYNMSEGYLDALEEIQSKQFSLEDMKKAIEMAQEEYYNEGGYQGLEYEPEQIIQSLLTQQLPKEFIPEYYTNGDMIVKNRNGVRELVGTYK